MRLTKQERKAIFRGTLKVLKRAEKPDQEAGAKLIVSYTQGGRQVVDRRTGETVDIPRQPRLWIVIKGWHLKAGSTEWETSVEIHDLREQNRVLANGIGGLQREAGLKTRWRETVAADGTAREKRVPKKGEQRENWTPETERGYGGRNELERCDFTGNLVPAAGVDDATLDDFAKRIEEENKLRRLGNQDAAEKMRAEMKVAKEYGRGKRSGASAAKRRAARAERRLEVVMGDSGERATIAA